MYLFPSIFLFQSQWTKMNLDIEFQSSTSQIVLFCHVCIQRLFILITRLTNRTSQGMS